MGLSFLFENLGTALLTILAFVVGILLFPVVAAVKRSRNPRQSQAQRAREPRVQPDLYGAYRRGRYTDRVEPYERPHGGYGAYGPDDGYRRPDWDHASPDANDDDYPQPGRGYAGHPLDDGYPYPDRGHPGQDGGGAVGYRGYGSYADDPPDDRSLQPSDRWAVPEKQSEGTVRPIFGSGGFSQMRKSARPAGPAKGLWFVFGVTVGIAATVIWSSVTTSGSLMSLVAFLDNPNPTAIADEPASAAGGKAPEQLGPFGQTASGAPTAVDQGDIGQLIDAFVASLRSQLPMTVGPGITMAAVEADSNIIALGFTIAQAIAEEDEPKLQSELETRFRNSVCATEPDLTNIHGLNRRGVSFLINYTDLLGRNVAGLTVEPNYCASPA